VTTFINTYSDMKQTTESIQNIMVKEFLQSVKEIQKNAIKYNFPDAV